MRTTLLLALLLAVHIGMSAFREFGDKAFLPVSVALLVTAVVLVLRVDRGRPWPDRTWALPILAAALVAFAVRGWT